MSAADAFPPELELQPFYANSPNGRVFIVFFSWSSPDHERGQKYLNKVTSWSTVIHKQVTACTVPEILATMGQFVSRHAYANPRMLPVRTLTPAVIDTIDKYCGRMPTDPGVCFTWHAHRANTPSTPNGPACQPSVFGSREPHFLIQILANAVDKKNYNVVSKWGHDFRDELLQQGQEAVLPSRWIPLTPDNEMPTLDVLMGEDNASWLREMKKQKDSRGLFRYALPRIAG